MSEMKEKIIQLRKFINSQRLYVWLVIFIIMLHAAGMFLSAAKKDIAEEPKTLLSSRGTLAERKADLETKVRENKNLAVLIGLAIMMISLVILVGLVLDLVILVLKINNKALIRRSLPMSQASWTALDVTKIVILFIFFAYALTLVELVLSPMFPSIKTQESLRTAVNTTLLDLLAVWFVLYFAIVKYKEKPTNLGLSFKNFFRNFFYGIAAYIAAAPALILVLVLLMWIVGLFKYQPPPQPVLELFMEEKKIPALVYISIFVGILGPIAEEMFFRGFMYNAMKKKMGVTWALVSSSLLFAFLHAHLVGFLPIMILGLLLAYLYEKTGSLVASMTVHVIHNSAMIFLVFLMKEVYF